MDHHADDYESPEDRHGRLLGVLGDMRFHYRRAAALRTEFALGVRKTHEDAAELQTHLESIEACRRKLPKPRLVSVTLGDAMDHPELQMWKGLR